jgi:hypothetical protein
MSMFYLVITYTILIVYFAMVTMYFDASQHKEHEVRQRTGRMA